jgi:hypothetical protein
MAFKDGGTVKKVPLSPGSTQTGNMDGHVKAGFANTNSYGGAVTPPGPGTSDKNLKSGFATTNQYAGTLSPDDTNDIGEQYTGMDVPVSGQGTFNKPLSNRG